MSTPNERIERARADRRTARTKIPRDDKVVEALYEIVEALHDLKNAGR